MPNRIRIGVSSCLLGEKVRYDGGHKLDRYVVDVLGNYFDFVPVCPEVECGLPVPREAMHLAGDPAAPRLVTVKTGVDLTEKMHAYVVRRLEELEKDDLCGFIFKKNSPSSGLYRVKVYNQGMPARSGSGLFAAAVARRFPLLPVEEEGRLNDPALRENFLERVFAFRRWKDLLKIDGTPGGLVQFHTRHKLQVMAHSPRHYRELGRLVAGAGSIPQETRLQRYGEQFLEALSMEATTAKNTNVLQHIMGYFKKRLSADEKCELLELIGRYRQRTVPLVVPLTLLCHYVRKYDEQYLRGQTYLEPHPQELMLRNRV